MAQTVSRASGLNKRNVLVFKYDDVTRRDNEVFTPNLMEMARLRKSEQFRKDICFYDNMSRDDIRKTLEEAIPILKNKRFSCAGRASQSSAKLDFHGERRVWDGSTVKKKLRGQSALYIVMEDKFEETSQVSGSATSTSRDFTGLTICGNIPNQSILEDDTIPLDLKDVNPGNFGLDCKVLQDVITEIVQEDSQTDTLVDRPLLDSAGSEKEQNEAPVITADHDTSDCDTSETPAESGFSSAEDSLSLDAIHPRSGPLEGGESFYVEFDKSLPDSMKTGWAEFGPKRTPVWKTSEGNTLFGKNIPSGETPGPVTVKIFTQTGEYLGKTVYTYLDRRKEESENITSKKRQLADLFENWAKRLKGGDSEDMETQDSQQQGLPLLVTAAEIGAKNFIEAVFSSSAGRIAFECYKNESPSPEDIAEDNGHEEIAAYLRGIRKKFSEEDGTNHTQPKVMDWLDRAEAFVDSKVQPGPSFEKHLWEDDLSETSYFGDLETSSSSSEDRSDSIDDFVTTSFFKEIDIHQVPENDEQQMFEGEHMNTESAEKSSTADSEKQRSDSEDQFQGERSQVTDVRTNVEKLGSNIKRAITDAVTTDFSQHLNFFKFSSVVLDEFPVALRQVFVYMWDNQVAPTPGFIQWDDSPLVRNMFLKKEGGKTKYVPTNKSFTEWDCTALFEATLFAQSFAMPDKRGSFGTLSRLYVKSRRLLRGTFHPSVTSPCGNQAETFALALDQLRLLRNTLYHQITTQKIVKATFDNYIQLAKDAFVALGQSTTKIDDIGELGEKDFPTPRVQQLEEELRREKFKQIEVNLDQIESQVKDAGSDVKDVKSGVTDVMTSVEGVTSDVKTAVKDVQTKVDEVGLGVKMGATNVKTKADEIGPGVAEVKTKVDRVGKDMKMVVIGMNTKVDEVTSDVKTAAAEVKTKVDEVGSDVKTAAAEVKTEVDEVGSEGKTAAAEVKTKVDDVGSDVKTAAAEVKTEVDEVGLDVKTAAAEVKTEVDEVGLDVKTAAAEVKTEVDEVGSEEKTAAAEVKTKVDEVGSDVKTAAGEVKTKVDEVGSDVKTAAAEVKTKVDEVGSDVKTAAAVVKTKVDEVGSDVKTAAAEVKRKVDEVGSDVKTAAAVVKTKVDEVGSDVKTAAAEVKAKVDEVGSEVGSDLKEVKSSVDYIKQAVQAGTSKDSPIMEYSLEELNFFRLCKIGLDIFPVELRKIFKQEWDFLYSAMPGGKWQNTAQNGKDFYDEETKGKKTPMKVQCLNTVRNGKTEEWDCTCLFSVILYSNAIGFTLAPGVRAAVDDLRQVRNDVAHPTCTKLTDVEFQNYTTRVLNAFTSLGLPINEIEDIKNQTSFPSKELENSKKQVQSKEAELNTAKEENKTQELSSKLQPFCFLTLKPPHEVIRRVSDTERIKDKMQELHNGAAGAVSTIYLSGIPGCGKSQLARQLGQEFFSKRSDSAEDMKFVATLNAESIETLADSYMTLARHLGITEYTLTDLETSKREKSSEAIKQLQRLILTKVRKFSKWMIIADNVVDLKLVGDFLPQTGSEEWGHGQVLITTKDSSSIPHNAPQTYHESFSEGMMTDDAVELLEKVSQISDRKITEVAEFLDYQPLALAAAAYYVQTVVKNGCPNYSWTNYLASLIFEILSATESSAYAKKATTAITMAVQRAAETDEVLRETFSFLALCSSEIIPLEAVVNFVRARLTDQPEELIKAKILRSSLILVSADEEVERQYLGLHNIVYAVLRQVVISKLEPSRRYQIMAEAVRIFNSLLSSANENYALLDKLTSHCKSLLEYMTLDFTPLDSTWLKQLTPFMTVGEVVDWLDCLADACVSLSDFSSAKYIVDLACSLLENISDTEEGASLKARIFNTSGVVYNITGKHNQAKEFHEKALMIQKKIFYEEHSSVATSYNNLVLVYECIGEYNQTKELHEKALMIRKMIFGEEHSDVATSYNNSAGVYYRFGECKQAKELYEKAKIILKKIYGEEQP